MTATLESAGQNRYKVVGPLTFATVSALLRQSQSLFEPGQRIEIDLASIPESDSAGLALLIEWMRRARAQGHAVTYRHVPEQLCALARISEVDELLKDSGWTDSEFTSPGCGRGRQQSGR